MKIDCRIRFCTDMDYTVNTERARMWKPFVSDYLTTYTLDVVEDDVETYRINLTLCNNNIRDVMSAFRHFLGEMFCCVGYKPTRYYIAESMVRMFKNAESLLEIRNHILTCISGNYEGTEIEITITP